MKNRDSWTATKFSFDGVRLSANADSAWVAISSRLNVSLLASGLQPLLAEYARGHLLDLGCGNAPLFAVYRNRVTEVTCIDWSNSGHQLRHIDVACDLNGPIPLEDRCVNTVLLTDVLEHIAEPVGLIREIARVTAPGGCLIGSVPFTYRLHEEPYDYYRFTRHALLRLAKLAGLQVVVLEPYGQGMDVVFDSLGKVVVDAHWRWGPRMAAWMQCAGLKFRRTRLGMKINRANGNMPLGYVFVMRRECSSAGDASEVLQHGEEAARSLNTAR